MGIRIRFLALASVAFLGSCFAPPVAAAATTPVQCASNDNRVWVYDSLTDFAVSMRLKCGEEVEIVGRVKGYVKIRTVDGKEGYVPETAFPDLPPFVDPNSNATDGLEALIRAREAHAAPRPNPAPATATGVSASAATPASAPVTSVAQPLEPAAAPAQAIASIARPAASVSVPATPPAPATVLAVAPAAAPPSEPVVAVTPAPAPAAVPVAVSPAAKVKPVSVTPRKTRPAAKKPGIPQNAEATSSAISVASAQPASPETRTRAKASADRPYAAKASDRNEMQVVVLSSNAAVTAPRIESAVQTNPMAAAVDVNQPATPSAPRDVADDSDSEDYPDAMPDDASADPACRTYFSAYGLAPAQSRWLEEVRKKQYPSICPAPSVSKVDFVMIFTHDIDIYNSALPDVVHVDRNGFSDFDPVSTVDTALMSQAAANKAHRQYVWVFTMKRGAFDPSKFSPRRRPQFTKSEVNSLTSSHAAERAVEDAFEFVQQQGSPR
jgi:hypothetical protein